MNSERIAELSEIARQIRVGVIEGTHAAKSGHPGGSLSIAELLAYLYWEEMDIDPKDPQKADRDRLVLSKGHCCPGLYAALALRGYFPVEDLKTLRHLDSYLQGHPDCKHTPGIDMSSGSLGQGVSVAVGMSLAAKMDGSARRVYAILGDGESEEGQVWEAAMFAGHRKLDNLCFILDVNGLQIDGALDEVVDPRPHDAKFAAFGWNVISVGAHDFNEIEAAFKAARAYKGKPTIIIAHSVKGRGVSFMENNVDWHGKAPNDEEYAIAMADLAAAKKD